MSTQKRKTNVQIMRAMIAAADRDVMLQLFIMDALHKCADACAAADAAQLQTGFMSGEAWKAAAVRLQALLAQPEGN
jgi:hypothetical protein